MKRHRVLLHSMTFYRDYITLYLLSRLLERGGCSCIIVPNEYYLSRISKAWNPDAIFYVTSSRSRRIMDTYPNSRLFYCAGEGGEDHLSFDEKFFIFNQDVYERLEGIYLWGRRTKSYIDELIQRPEHVSIKNCIERNDKFLTTGSPRMDLILWGKTHTKTSSQIRVGFIGNCSYINDRYRPLAKLMDYPNLHGVMSYSLDLMKFFVDVLNALPSDRYKFSIRPYPIEPRDTYLKTELVRSGKLELDKSIDFSTWLHKQDVVIGDISSTVAPCILSGKKYINTSRAVFRPSESYFFSLVDYFKEKLEDVSPHNPGETVSIIRNMDTNIDYPADFLNLFDDMYNYRSNNSAIVAIAKDMLGKLHDRSPLPAGVPTPIISSALRLLQLRTGLSYSKIDWGAVRRETATHADPLVDTLLATHNDTSRFF